MGLGGFRILGSIADETHATRFPTMIASAAPLPPRSVNHASHSISPEH